MFTTIQEGIQAIQKQVLSDTPPEHVLYIPAQGKRTTYATEDAFDLYPAVNEFLKFPALNIVDQKNSKDQKTQVVDNGRKVLLLLGDTGSGKSLFCQDLVTRLWQSYKPGNPIPLFISLARLQDPVDNAIEETLTNYGFSAEQIATLKKEQPFIFVLDGYDEIHQFKNLYVTNKLNEWNARAIITCRSQYLYYLSDTDKHFMPFHGEKRQPHLLQQYYVAPFSEKEIVAYVQQYEKLNGQAVVADLKDHKSDAKGVETPKSVLYQQLISIPGLQSLITTPFLLHLAVEALPDILVKYKSPKDQKNTEQQKLTQAALYDVFIERWFKRQELKLKTSKHIDAKAADPKPNFWKFCKELAVTMRTQNVTLINYTPEKVSKFASATAQAKLNPWKQFFSEDQETELLRSACPIRKLGPNQYGFIHASLIEYFATRAMYEEVIVQQLSSQAVIVIAANSDGRDDKLSIDAKDQKVQSSQQTNLLPLPQSTLYQSSITKQNNMIKFLADRVQESEVFKRKLFEAIENSKKDERYATGAANAITALNCAEVNFNSMDFNGIRIPEANLSGSLCDNTNFSNANLSNVNFQGAWLREAKLSGAQVAQVRFGELPFIKMKEAVDACAYSPNGRWLAIAAGKDIAILEAATRRLMHQLSGHTNGVSSVSWDAQGERLASGSYDKTVRVWEAASGKELRCLSGHMGKVSSVSWDAQGERLASGSDDATVRVWEVSSGKELRCLSGYTSQITNMSWDAKGERLAWGSTNNTVCVLEATSGRELHCLSGHTENVTNLSWDPKGERLASGSLDNTVRVWETNSGKELRCLRGHMQWITHVSWDPKGERLASGSWDKTVRVWEADRGKELRCLSGHTNRVTSVSWDAKGEHLASSSEDKTVRVWVVSMGKELRCLSGHTYDVTSVSWNAMAKRLASGSEDKTVRVWEADSGKELRCLSGHTYKVTGVSWDAKGEHLASGSWDQTVRVWEASSGKELSCLSGHTGGVTSVSWDATAKRLASSSDRTMWVWETGSGKELRCLSGHTDTVTGVGWDAKGERLASGSDDETVRVWEASTGKELCRLIGHTGWVKSVSWDAKGERLASGSDDETVRVWDASTGKELCCLRGHMGKVSSVSWDAKGECLASGGLDKTLRVWEACSGKALYCLKLPYVVTSCTWISRTATQDSLAVAFGNFVGCFDIKHSATHYQAALCWLNGTNAVLQLFGLDMANTTGLSSSNHMLLQQHGAVGEIISVDEDVDGGELEAMLAAPRVHGSAVGSRNSFFKSRQPAKTLASLPTDVKQNSSAQNAKNVLVSTGTTIPPAGPQPAVSKQNCCVM